MNQQQFLIALGLSTNATESEVNEAYKNKLADLQDKVSSAPTDALKQKFQDLIVELDQAKAQFKAAAPRPGSSPLSDTKMADLPGMGHVAGAQIDLQVGQVLAGRYEVKEQIGAGGMGAVYRAHDKNTGKDIALKVLLPALLKNERARERFLDEARLSQQLSHPNIVNVYDVQHDGEFYFLTMELLEGQDLRQVMENRKLARQPFDIDDVKEIIQAVSEGLAYAHKHTVHRDIKPENIWLTEQGEYKIMDFGIARVQSATQRTQTGAAMGTAYYMAPEQLKGQADIDGRADQYALAVLSYELLSGEVPAGMIEPIQQHRKDIPKGMAQAIHQALSPKPENRFADISAFREAIVSGKGGTGMNLPALPMKNLGLVAGVVLAIGVVVTLFAAVDFSNLIPESEEVVAARKAEVAKLTGEIKTYKRRLENGRRQLDGDIRDAKRDAAGKVKALEHWQTLTENYIFNGSALTELEGNLSMGETLLRDKSFEQANATLVQVRDGYKKLWENFSAAEKLNGAEQQNQQAKNKWLKRKADYKLEDPDQVELAKQPELAAEQHKKDGSFSQSLLAWKAAEQQWKRAYEAVAEQVLAIDKTREQARLNSPEYQYKQGKKFYSEKNYATAFSWYMKAAKQNHGPAEFSVYGSYNSGRGVEQNKTKAIAWLKRSAEHGHRDAIFYLAEYYEEKKNHKEALIWYSMLAKKGDRPANYKLALIYNDKNLDFYNPVKSLKLYKEAAGLIGNHSCDNGNLDCSYRIESQIMVAVIYADRYKKSGDSSDSFSAFLYACQAVRTSEKNDTSFRHIIKTVFSGTEIDVGKCRK